MPCDVFGFQFADAQRLSDQNSMQGCAEHNFEVAPLPIEPEKDLCTIVQYLNMYILVHI